MPSRVGEDILEKAFPEMAFKSTIALVLARPDAQLTENDKAVALRLAETFAPKPGEKTPVSSVLTHEDRFIGKRLASPDGQAVLVVLQLNSEFMAVDNVPFMKDVYRKVRERSRRPTFPPA